MARLNNTISMLGDRPDKGRLLIACVDLVLTFKSLFDPYRPELHYMRGPGPKWHAKHGRSPVPVECRS
jgi:hypothetical protein